MNVQELAEPYDGCYVFLLPDADCGILAVTDSGRICRITVSLRDVVRTLREALGSTSRPVWAISSRRLLHPHSYELAPPARECGSGRAVP